MVDSRLPTIPAPSRFKLAVGKQLAAWRAYPEMRRRLDAIPPGPPILVTGAHRSGTTWFGGMLAASGIWHVHEPTAPYQGLWSEWYSYAPAHRAIPHLDAVIAQVLQGGCRRVLNLPWAEHPTMPLRWLAPRPHRVLIKDPIASLAAESLVRRFDMRAFALLRHPCAFVESVVRLGWSSGKLARQFLADAGLMADALDPLRNLMQRTDEGDPVFDAAVVHACINRVLWTYAQRNPAIRLVVFEQVAADPIAYFEALYLELGLPLDEPARQRLRELSETRMDTARAHQIQRRSRDQIGGWRDRLPADAVVRVHDVWLAAELPFFKEAEQW